MSPVTAMCIGAGLFGGGILLCEVKVWVVERWGGRLAAKLVLKARHLRKESISLRNYRVSLNAQRGKLSPQVVVAPHPGGDNGHESNQGNPSLCAHNVLPFKKSRRSLP